MRVGVAAYCRCKPKLGGQSFAAKVERKESSDVFTLPDAGLWPWEGWWRHSPIVSSTSLRLYCSSYTVLLVSHKSWGAWWCTSYLLRQGLPDSKASGPLTPAKRTFPFLFSHVTATRAEVPKGFSDLISTACSVKGYQCVFFSWQYTQADSYSGNLETEHRMMTLKPKSLLLHDRSSFHELSG